MLIRSLTALLAVGCLAALALPASAKSVYSWTTDDGVQSFTDDAKRVPRKYEASVERREMRSIEGYARYTPTPAADRAAYLERMPAHLATLRAKNAERAAAPVMVQSGAAAGTGTVYVGSGRRGTQGFAFSGAASDEGPIVVEKLRTRPETGNATRQITVVRQGDKILAVLKAPLNDRQLVELDERDLAE